MAMMQCWDIEAHNRPSFSSLVGSLTIKLEAMADYLRLGTTTYTAAATLPSMSYLECNENNDIRKPTMSILESRHSTTPFEREAFSEVVINEEAIRRSKEVEGQNDCVSETAM